MTYDFTTIDLRVIFAALAIIVAIVIAFYSIWWRNRKRLSYEVLSNVVLISAEKEIEDKVEIHFEGHSVKNVRLLVIRLINDGQQPIKKDDFEKSIEFVFPEAKILTAEKVKFHPENLATQMAYRDEKLEIDPALFNPKDYVEFKVLVSGYKGLKPYARVTGVSRIGDVKASFKSRYGGILVISLVQAVGLGGMIIYAFWGRVRFWIGLIGVLLLFLTGPIVAWYHYKTERN